MIKKQASVNIKEVITVPNTLPPPAMVQNVSTFAHHYKQDELKRAEAVVACIVLEAGGEGKTGMEAVNEVIHNRATHQNKSLYAIVTAHKQFSCFNNGVDAAIAKAKKHPKWKEAIQILQAPLTNHTQGAVYYHTIHVRPYWVDDLIDKGYETVKINHHIFYHI